MNKINIIMQGPEGDRKRNIGHYRESKERYPPSLLCGANNGRECQPGISGDGSIDVMLIG